MRWRIIGPVGVACSTLVLAFSLNTPAANGAPLIQQITQPSPRPTLIPTAVVIPTATAAPVSTTAPTTREGATVQEPVVQFGRITGTVIDQTTGAPAPNVPVTIGGNVVMSDVSGNYDHWMVAGTYSVALALKPEQGMALQNAQEVAITGENTTVLHLNYRSPAPAAATTAPAAPSAAPVSASTEPASPSAEPAGVAAPVVPQRLPKTAETPEGGISWLPFGMLLLAMGMLLSLRPVRMALLPASVNARYDDGTRLLAALLTASPRRQRHQSQRDNRKLLEKLLSKDQ